MQLPPLWAILQPHKVKSLKRDVEYIVLENTSI